MLDRKDKRVEQEGRNNGREEEEEEELRDSSRPAFFGICRGICWVFVGVLVQGERERGREGIDSCGRKEKEGKKIRFGEFFGGGALVGSEVVMVETK